MLARLAAILLESLAAKMSKLESSLLILLLPPLVLLVLLLLYMFCSDTPWSLHRHRRHQTLPQ